MPDTNGNPHPRGPQTVGFWMGVIQNVVIATTYADFMMWNIHYN
jgi:hypothetical protein